ncbi:hypothetical protein CEXT_387601 [Caerostris extrusa]|uniref:Uncharacterized protein n=1 Tax=Caerostris extrusa TaxID=172846 RepID=A0AAV4UN75_CAEEX|nr:hypothetical protein CEXT_387601 [Caerostris extrusa]
MLVSPILIASRGDLQSEKITNPSVRPEIFESFRYKATASLIAVSSLMKLEAIRPVFILWWYLLPFGSRKKMPAPPLIRNLSGDPSVYAVARVPYESLCMVSRPFCLRMF